MQKCYISWFVYLLHDLLTTNEEIKIHLKESMNALVLIYNEHLNGDALHLPMIEMSYNFKKRKKEKNASLGKTFLFCLISQMKQIVADIREKICYY